MNCAFILSGSAFALRFISDSEDSFDWAIDNVYIGSGCSLQCVQHGSCVNNTCRYLLHIIMAFCILMFILLCYINSIFYSFVPSLITSSVRCDDGFSSSQCQPTVSVPSFKEEFEATLQSNRWPIVTGGSILSSDVSSGNALVFYGVR